MPAHSVAPLSCLPPNYGIPEMKQISRSVAQCRLCSRSMTLSLRWRQEAAMGNVSMWGFTPSRVVSLWVVRSEGRVLLSV